MGVHAAVLKPDIADAGRVVGEGVGDLGGSRWREGARSGELTLRVALPEGQRGQEVSAILVLVQESAELSPRSNSEMLGRPPPPSMP